MFIKPFSDEIVKVMPDANLCFVSVHIALLNVFFRMVDFQTAVQVIESLTDDLLNHIAHWNELRMRGGFLSYSPVYMYSQLLCMCCVPEKVCLIKFMEIK